MKTARKIAGSLVETLMTDGYLLWVEVRTSRIAIWLMRKVCLNHSIHYVNHVHWKGLQCFRLQGFGGSETKRLEHIVLGWIHFSIPFSAKRILAACVAESSEEFHLHHI